MRKDKTGISSASCGKSAASSYANTFQKERKKIGIMAFWIKFDPKSIMKFL